MYPLVYEGRRSVMPLLGGLRPFISRRKEVSPVLDAIRDVLSETAVFLIGAGLYIVYAHFFERWMRSRRRRG